MRLVYLRKGIKNTQLTTFFIYDEHDSIRSIFNNIMHSGCLNGINMYI